MTARRPWQPRYRRIAGQDIKAKPVWVCTRCLCQHETADGKPAVCVSCRECMEFDYFASKAEANRWAQLILMEKGKEITQLHRQPRFALLVWALARHGGEPVGKPVKIGDYIADFEYFDLRHDKMVVEDVKSGDTMTDIAAWKIKHMGAQYGITVTLVSSKDL